ncbi:MAG: hypothetical protein JKY15_05975 [Deltaproteobacteria bacterium]|nr:hypothetical protein [Deltaproteobacteria bacterium]
MKLNILILFLFCNSAFSTVAVIHSLKTMTKRSGVVLEAEVLSQDVFEDEKGRIITLSKLLVKDGLKGAKTGEEITLYQIGGEYKGRVMRFQGSSVFSPGEHIILFGTPYKDKIVQYGLGIGKFKVIKTHRGGEVVEDIHDLDIARKSLSGIHFFEAPKPRKYPSLEDFKNKIRSAL